MGGVNGEIFNKVNGGIIEINDDLKSTADRMLVELEEYQKYLETLGPGENPPTMGGNNTTLFVVDNNPYLDEFENPPTMGGNENPNTGGTGTAVASGLALAACGISFHLLKKKKDR